MSIVHSVSSNGEVSQPQAECMVCLSPLFLAALEDVLLMARPSIKVVLCSRLDGKIRTSTDPYGPPSFLFAASMEGRMGVADHHGIAIPYFDSRAKCL